MPLATPGRSEHQTDDDQAHFYICDSTGTCISASPLTDLEGQQLTEPSGSIWQQHGLPAGLGAELKKCLYKVLRSREIIRILMKATSTRGEPTTYACQFMPATLDGDARGVALQIRQLPSASDAPAPAVTSELLDAVPQPMVVIRVSDWKCLHANIAAAALFGFPVSRLLGHDLSPFFGQASDPLRILERLVVEGQIADFESHIIDRDENRQRIMISGGCAFSEGSEAAMLVITPNDASPAPGVAADRDALTGLLNRNALTDRLDDAIRRAAPLKRIVAALFIDLDGFKEVNNQYGHLIGDQLLSIIATRLAGCVRHYETLARLGGDEFVIILDGLRNSQDAIRVKEDVRRVVAQPVSLGKLSLTVTASIGIAYSPIDAPSARTLIHAADQAMYRHKDTEAASTVMNDGDTSEKVSNGSAVSLWER